MFEMETMKSFFFVVTFLACCCFSVTRAATLAEIIANDNELSEFEALLDRSEIAKTVLKHTSVTVFAPTKAAFARYRGPHQNSPDLLMYHIVKSSMTSDNFPSSMASEVPNGPPIWLKRNYDQNHLGSPKYEYYVNNARIIRLDVRGRAVEGHEQVLHVIDEVLDPIVPIPDDPNLRNPSAFRLIANPASYGIDFDFSNLVKVAGNSDRNMVLQGGDGHTFFLPMSGDNLDIWGKVDGKVIDAHIIPNQVFFSRTFPAQPQESMAYSEMLKTSLLLTNETSFDGRTYELQVQSNTAVGYQSYPRGVVVARVIKANLPVKNGVVHIIENPLVVNNRDLFHLVEQNPNLEEFFRLLNQYGQDVLAQLRQAPVTLFAPSNKAFKTMDKERLGQILNSEEKIRQLLFLHLVPQELSSESIAREVSRAVQSGDRARKLHVSHSGGAITVLGGGVNATVTVADIGATNGYLHIINKILGIPYHTIYEKLKSDQGLSATFRLGQQRGFNNQFVDLNKKFTYFVPHNEAWDKVERQYRSEHNMLFSPEYAYQAVKILQRHLVVNQRFTLEQMLSMRTVQMYDGTFDVTQSGGKYFVNWEGETAEIMDADVETTNGMVHVIRSVLFKRRDLTNEATSTTTTGFHLATIVAMFASTAFVKFVV